MVHLIQDSQAFFALLSLWALLAPAESLPSPVSAIAGPTTQAARLEDRDINSICGFWLDSAGATWSWWCNFDEPCAIDTYVTPNVVFCSQEALIPYTSWYDYGKWPSGGCGFQETCCPSTIPKVNEGTFDGGASIWYGCVPSDYPVPVRAVTTQIGDLSVFLTPYVAHSTSSFIPSPSIGPATSATPPTTQSTGATAPAPSSSSSSSSPEASVSTQATSSSPTDPGSVSSVDQSSLSASQSAISAPSPSASSSQLNGLSIGSEIGSIVGAIFGGLALIVAVYFGRKQYLRARALP